MLRGDACHGFKETTSVQVSILFGGMVVTIGELGFPAASTSFKLAQMRTYEAQLVFS